MTGGGRRGLRRPASVRARATGFSGAFALVSLLLGAGAASVAVCGRLDQQAEVTARGTAEKVQSSALVLGGLDEALEFVNRTADPGVRVARGTQGAPGAPAPRGLSLWPFAARRDVARTYATVVSGAGGTEPVVVTVDMRRQQEELDRFVATLAGAAGVLTGVVAITTWIVAGRVLRPVDVIRREVSEITETDLSRRVPVPPSGDELAHLAETMNDMLDRLQSAVGRQQRFVADASHELRTPLAALRAELEIALRYPDDAEWPQVVHEALGDTLRLERLTADLLLLTRLESDRLEPSAREPLDLVRLALEECARRRGERHDLRVEAAGPVLVVGRPALLSRLLGNLLDNAVRHARSGVVVRVRRDRYRAVLEVLDDGPGIPASQLEDVFERFTRLDDARARDDGGAGLGLAIARRIATVHGGTLRAVPTERGARFVARIPAAAAHPGGGAVATGRAATPPLARPAAPWPARPPAGSPARPPAGSPAGSPARSPAPPPARPPARWTTRGTARGTARRAGPGIRRPGRAGATARAVTLLGALSLALTSSAPGGPAPPLPAGSGFNAALGTVVRPSDDVGGVLRIGALSGEVPSLDPGNIATYAAFNLARLYARTLTAYASAPGAERYSVVPDLAVGPGRVSDGGRTVTYRIRPDVRYDDGSVVTTRDIKYAIERSNYGTEVLPSGPGLLREVLADDAYPGPYRDPTPGRLGLRSVETPDDTTIVFHLKAPFADLDHLLAGPDTAPVPPHRDTGRDYTAHVASTGPYLVAGYRPDEAVVLRRNPAWSPAGDPLRRQLNERIEVTVLHGELAASELDRRLVSGEVDVSLDNAVAMPETQARVIGDPDLRQNIDDPPTGLLFLAVNPQIPPFGDVHCRRAVHYAVSKAAVQNAYGGPVSAGGIATNLLPPEIPGREAFERYPNGPAWSGNARAAEAELAACGASQGFEVTLLARSDHVRTRRAAQAIAKALGRAGLRTSVRYLSSPEFASGPGSSTEYVHSHQVGLILSAWVADWPTGLGFLPGLVDSRRIASGGLANLAEERNPRVDALLDLASATPDRGERERIYRRIDREVMEDATVVPLLDLTHLTYRTPQLRNAYVNAYGLYDLASLTTSGRSAPSRTWLDRPGRFWGLRGLRGLRGA